MSDRSSEISAMGHFMLPDVKGNMEKKNFRPAKYGDTCLEEMLRLLDESGCRRTMIIAKAAGGASMFRRFDNRTILDIARRNIFSLRTNLARLQVPLVAEDLGGTRGRTITFYPRENRLNIKILDNISENGYRYVDI